MNNSKAKNTATSTPGLPPYVISPDLHGALHGLHNAVKSLSSDNGERAMSYALMGICTAGESADGVGWVRTPLSAELSRLCPAPRDTPRSAPRPFGPNRCGGFVTAWLIANGHADAESYGYDEDDVPRGVVTWMPVEGGGES